MIHISEIKYRPTDTGGRIEADVTIDGKTETLWMETGKEYAQYLTYERSDAFIVGMVNWAMREGHDISAETPMTESLYHQLTTYLIPGLVQGSPRMKAIKINVPIATEPLPNAGFVGTGITCGVDSLYSVATNESDQFPSYKLTHLTLFNVGSHGEGEEAKRIYEERLQIARDFCKETGYPLVTLDSNLQDIIPQNHFLTATYSGCFAILGMQKMWRRYHLASAGNDFEAFTLKDNDLNCSEDQELFLLPLLSTDQLRIESSGAGVTRQNKLKKVAEYEPSYKSLNVCIKEAHNCSRCEKCIRTMLGLDALGQLEKYGDVFDLEFYNKNRNYCYKVLMIKYFLGWKLHAEIYRLLKHKIPFKVKAESYIKYLYGKYFLKTRI